MLIMKIDNNLIQTNDYQRDLRTTKDKEKEINELTIKSKKNEDGSHKIKIDSRKERQESYDIRNATYEELTSICNDLYRSNKISLYERGMLTFNPGKSSQGSNRTHDNANTKYNLKNVDLSGKKDWLLEFEKRIKAQKKLGNKLGADHMEKILNKVKRLFV